MQDQPDVKSDIATLARVLWDLHAALGRRMLSITSELERCQDELHRRRPGAAEALSECQGALDATQWVQDLVLGHLDQLSR